MNLSHEQIFDFCVLNDWYLINQSTSRTKGGYFIYIRAGSAMALGKIGIPGVMDLLLQTLQDKHEWARAAAAKELEYLRDGRTNLLRLRR